MKTRGPIIQIFASASWGGGEQFVYDLTQRLTGDGRRVVLVSRPSGVIGEMVRPLGVPYHTLPMKGVADAVSALRLFRLVRHYRPSVLHVHNFKDAFTAAYAVQLCRLFSSFPPPRVVLTRHLVRSGKRGPLYKWLYAKLDRLVFVSECARQAFLRPGLDASRTTVIRNSAPEPAAAEELPDLRVSCRLQDGTPLLLFCGRCVPEKGCDVLLRACARLGDRPFALFFAGAFSDADYERELQALVPACGLSNRVFFLGFVPGASRLMAQADICAVPSVVPEALGLTVVEAMQAGCAVVTTDNGAQPEYLDDGISGLLVPPGDEQRLSEALARLLDDPALRKRLGETAREQIRERLPYDRFFKDYCTIYDA